MKNRLYILKTPFKDAALSDADYFCWTCVLLEGVISQFPDLEHQLTIHRVGFDRPRHNVIEEVGEDNQSLPMLVLEDNSLKGFETGVFNGNRFIKGREAILDALHQAYGIPIVHP